MAKPFMTRRGFFQTLFGQRKAKLSFFALQLVFDAFGHEELRARLTGLIDSPGSETPDEKRRFYKSVTGLLREVEPYLEYACFEYIVEPTQAEEAFHEWVADIEAGIASEEEEVGDTIDGYHRMDNEKGYVAVTLLLLFEQAHPLDGELDEEEEDLYTRAHLGKMVDSINRIDFNRTVADAAFIVPGSAEDGFSWADLADESWSHLKTVNG
ncbi:MAG: hypothetical protein AAFS10_14855 [Myxococcota bacterium]